MYRLSNLLNELKDSSAPVAFNKVSYTGNQLFALSSSVYSELQNISEAECLLVCEDGFEFAAAFLALIHSDKKICLPPNGNQGTLGELKQNRHIIDQDFIRACSSSELIEFPQIKAEDCKISLFTSGSTGERKEVAKNLTHLEEEIKVLENTWDISGSVLATISHQHIYGLLFKILWPLCSGRPFFTETVLYEDEFNSHNDKLTDYVIVSCPAHLDAVICFQENKFLKNRTVFSSGAPLSLKTSETIKEINGASPLEVFGSTETGGIGWRQQTESVNWTLLDKVEVKVEDQTLFVKSPFSETSEWYQTGDKAEIITEKQFKHLGRRDRITKVSGKRLSLDDLERRICESKLIDKCHVIVVNEKGFTERQSCAAVCILTNEGKKAYINEGKRKLVQSIKTKLKDYYEAVLVPRFWRFPDSFPVDQQGKMNSSAVKLYFQGITESEKRFPEIISFTTSTTELKAHLKVPKDLSFFDGHFDILPIFPGVAQIFWVTWLTEEIFGLRDPIHVKRLKFSNIIRPGSEVSIQINVNGEKLTFEYRNGERIFSSGGLIYDSL